MYMRVLPVCKCTTCAMPVEASRGGWIARDWSYWISLVTLWVLRIELESSASVAKALSC